MGRDFGTVTLRVGDRGARYPVTIDPLMSSPAWTANGNQADAEFGISVATAGDVNGDGYSDVIVGAPFYDDGQAEGRVYLCHGSSAGLALAPAITIRGLCPLGRFGSSAGTAGDVDGDGLSEIIVGGSKFTGTVGTTGDGTFRAGSASRAWRSGRTSKRGK